VTIQAVKTTDTQNSVRLDTLIDKFLQSEYDLKLAILKDDTEAVEGLDSTIREIEAQIQNFDCQTVHDRKRLGAFLIDHYLANEEHACLIPDGVIRKLKELIR